MTRVATHLALMALLGCSTPPGGGGPDSGGAGLDGAQPDTSEPVDVEVSEASVIGPGGDASAETSFGLPVIEVEVDPDLLDEMHENYDDDITAIVTLTMFGKRWEGVKFELHGGYARTLPKKTYRVVFPDDDKPVVDFFGDGAESQRRAVLQASWIDPTFVRNKLTFDLVRDSGGMAPRVDFCVLTLNGQWHGLYTVVERVDKLFLGRHDLDKDGNLYKAENHQANWDAKSDPLDGFDMEINEDNPTNDLGDLLDALTYTPQTHADFQVEVEPRLALDDFHAWQRVHVYALNRDTFTKNYYLYHDIDEDFGDPDARFRLISWDADATWGLNWDGKWLDTDEVTWHGTDEFSLRLYEIQSYKTLFRDAFLDALEDELAPATIATRVAASSSRIREAALADLEHWERDDIDFDSSVQALKDAVQARHDVMKTVLLGL
ncbi:MAG: CotH kinase family protein [Myxococcota bacterium]|nr:CotH kinase family protein [Myxococcota bacterium]